MKEEMRLKLRKLLNALGVRWMKMKLLGESSVGETERGNEEEKMQGYKDWLIVELFFCHFLANAFTFFYFTLYILLGNCVNLL